MEKLYNQDTISQAIHTEWAGKTVHFARETDSTNIWAKNLAKEGAPHGTLAVAEFQNAGRGRFARRWSAPEGSSVMMTLVLRPQIPPNCASMLTLVMGLSVAQAVEKVCRCDSRETVKETGVSAARNFCTEPGNFGVQIKWPNDVVLSRKKICGILTEMSVVGMDINYVVIGAGVNVNMKEFPAELADKATSLSRECGREFDRNEVAAAVMECFEVNYEKFAQTCDMSLLKDDYERYLANLGEVVRVLDNQNPYEGTCLGINEQGELLVRTADGGEVRKVAAGEVSVRGLYSYV
ncbi:biotin--[acetyl-CoA-carboxylase] ligase [Blautia schinkii]|nr:biotin--[acetyl-CoA-carboxylase] ligase [Blautia schinkii]